MTRALAQPRKRKSQKVVVVGPEDHGRRMSLDQFDRAEGREGYLYELSKGVIEVTDVPNPAHGRQLQSVRRQLAAYEIARPDVIQYMGGGSDAKLLIGPSESERHPDLSVYLTPAPSDDADAWSSWVPEIVIEIVSKRSAKRDYEDKPTEYLEFGVSEYWIVDATKKQITVLSRWRGQWKKQIIRATKKYSTGLLPGFSLDLKKVFDAAK
jgi:Uma2 family endonuclease